MFKSILPVANQKWDNDQDSQIVRESNARYSFVPATNDELIAKLARYVVMASEASERADGARDAGARIIAKLQARGMTDAEIRAGIAR